MGGAWSELQWWPCATRPRGRPSVAPRLTELCALEAFRFFSWRDPAIRQIFFAWWRQASTDARRRRHMGLTALSVGAWGRGWQWARLAMADRITDLTVDSSDGDDDDDDLP